MHRAALLVFEVLRLLLRLLLAVVCWHFVRATRIALRRQGDPAEPAPMAEWPTVAVQLPMRNEFYVARRVIEAACALDYPRDKLQIQVLDDSDDETRERVAEVVEALAARGHSVRVIRRVVAQGYKAGALADALAATDAELVAIFDADCVPPPEFLRRTVPHFADPTLGCVQVRWAFTNRTQNLLTRVQAIVLDGLMAVDQLARASERLPLQFNGTNGVWRRHAIEEAGGWDARSLAEDADLSFRAYLKGWRIVSLGGTSVPTELPEDMASFRAQQRRWALGSAQLLRSLGATILRSRIPLGAKLMMLLHLGRHSIDPLLLLTCLTAPFTTFYGMPYLVDYGPGLNGAVTLAVALSSFAFYATALAKVGAPRRSLLLIPLVIPLSIGLALVYTAAWLRGLLQSGGVFVRTPKSGGEAHGGGPTYRLPVDGLALVEVALGAAHLYFAGHAFAARAWLYGGFFLAVALGFGWVGGGTLVSALRRPSRRRP